MAGIYGAVLGSVTDIETRALELLDVLAARAESSASAICLWDPIQRRHIGVANRDYPEQVMTHFNTWFVDNDPLFDAMRVHGLGALRWRDFPQYRSGYSVNNVFRPAGFDEGLSARLVTTDGTYVGAIHVNCDDPRYPSDDDVGEINALRAQIAEQLDFSLRPRMVAELVAPDAQAWGIDDHGRAHLLRRGDGFGAALDPALVSELTMAFCAASAVLRPEVLRHHDGESWLHARRIPTTPRYHGDSLGGVLLVTRAPLPMGITPRELDALTLAVCGLTNGQIAAQLFISTRTAGHHLESAQAKLGASNRASCTSTAVSLGLLSAQVLCGLGHGGTASVAV
ncbi:helix-turn-helix transcriptional regulator [Mycolicibacterium vaccae]|jgi:DNA-binding CsgD family transcriptional regulator|uniref:Response regulator receiver protein n=1 Tax=Mycolicibacterium vaccae ATCC 25954 TaxID=1194972 RepID=K0V6W9_MYCVA|nr:helix-turn-helix transcriptional regulator [Mycolicibacterium vaccae]ANI41974.1 LuxR family transcriptional regulator [Mycolicibacterium vaccae 95051]EJZ10523.1 response regulator receiver protein [Mycolicibacterium vaccae ATCC 25954]